MLAIARQRAFTCFPMNANSFVSRSVALLSAFLLAAGCHKNEPAPPTAVAAGAQTPEIVSAEKTSFDEVTAKLNKGGNLFVYLSTEQALRGLSNRISSLSNVASAWPGIPSDARDKLGRALEALNDFAVNSGIDQISGIGMSSIAREPGFYYGKMVIHHYEGQNNGVIWSLFGNTPHPLQLDLLPESTALALFSDFDLPMAWTNMSNFVAGLDLPPIAAALHQAPIQFHEHTGLDLGDVLHSLDGAYGIIFTLDEHKKITLPVPGHPLEMPSPGLAIVIRVNSDIIFNRVDEALKGNPLVSKVDDPDLKMRTMNIPLPIPIDLRPTVARFGDYLVVASSDTLVREILAVKSGKNKGFTATDEFKKLSQGIPDRGNNFSLVTSAFSRAAVQVHQQFADQQAAAGQTQPLPQFFSGQSNSFSYSVGVNGPQGWEGFANGNHSMQALVVPAVAAVGAAAAIAVPNFVKARQAAQQKSSQP
jgi:hypothetical protein